MLCYVVAHVCVDVGQTRLKFLMHAKATGFFVLLEDRCRRMLQRARAVLGPALSIGSSGCRFPSVKGADLIPLADVVTSPSCQLSSMLAKFMGCLLMGKKDLLISERMGPHYPKNVSTISVSLQFPPRV